MSFSPASVLSNSLRLSLVLGVWFVFSLLGYAGSVVTVDADKVLEINGGRVFPIGFSSGPPLNAKTPEGKDALQELRDAGALLFRTYVAGTNASSFNAEQQQLNWAAAHGMYCWVYLYGYASFAAGDTNSETTLRTVVDQFKNDPALGLWKNTDEPWWNGVPVADMQRGYDVIKQEDTNHPVVTTQAPRGTVADLQPYDAAADVLGMDIYPIPAGKHTPSWTNQAISEVGDWTGFLGQVANGQKQYWMIEQIAWSGTTPPNNALVFPTLWQSRYMAYQAIANGARGLTFFGGDIAATLNLRDAPYGWNWTFWNDVLKPVVRELGDHGVLEAALTSPNSTLPISISGTSSPDLEFCVREAGPYLFIIATKREGATATVTFSGLPNWAATGEVLYESPRTVTATNAQFTDTFAPFDVHVYRFSQTNVPPSILFPP